MSVKLKMEAVNKTVTTEMEAFIVAVTLDISSVTITWIVMVGQNNLFACMQVSFVVFANVHYACRSV